MLAQFIMPTLGADMEAGTLIAWLKQPGERIERGEIIAEIDTDKGIIEVECYVSGVIEKLVIAPGEKVPVGTVMALIRQEGAEKEAEAAASPTIEPETRRARISPLARKIAEELGVDPSQVTGTGPGGRVTREDIEKAARLGQPVGDATARMRLAIAAAMTRSKREIPHYYLSTTIDLQRAMDWLNAANEDRPLAERLLPGALLIKATARALERFPELNAAWEKDQLRLKPEINPGIAISLRQGGLIAPALFQVNRQSLDELMKNLLDLVQRTRAGSLRSSELTDSTMTITNLGDQGVESVMGIIYPPQVALVGFGKIVERPWVVERQVVPRQVVVATLAGDHRAGDGHRGGLFLSHLDSLLQKPEEL